MAIYHYSVSIIGRSSGRSATAAAAYRAGEKISDLRTGQTFDYTRKKGVDATVILAPESAPNWVKNREQLWNEVERVERRKDSQLAREIDVAIPSELSNSQKQELVKAFVTNQFVSKGMVADVAFHHLDSHNPHAHILLTMRDISPNGFGKKNRDWNRKDLLEEQRSSWELIANRALEQAGLEVRIDHRSLEEQGINRIPQIHLGADVAAMLKRGIATERGEEYLSIQAANQKIKALEGQITAIEKTIETEKQSTLETTGKKVAYGVHSIPIGEVDLSIQVAKTTTNSQLEPEVASTEELATEQGDERTERENPIRTEPSNGLDQILDRLRASNQRAEELGERLSKPSRKAREDRRDSTVASREGETLFPNDSNSNREAKDLRDNPTDSNREADDRARGFRQLSERIIRSDSKDRKTRKSAGQGLGAIAAQLGEKIQQFAKVILGDSKDIEQRQVRSSELALGSDRPQANRTAQRDLDYPTVHELSNLGTQPNLSSQRQAASRDQGQGQQQRNPAKPNREEVRNLEPTPPPRPIPLKSDEVRKIVRTATEAIERYGKGLSNEKTFSNSYYQISLQAVFETYGWRHYLTVTANDGRGRILVLKGQNSNPSHMDVKENRLSKQDVNTFEKIQTALDYYRQIRQLKQDAQTILRRIGVPDPLHPLKGYGTFEGEKYRIVSEEMAFRIIANDGRGEILNYPNDPNVPHPEARALANFNLSDVELFRTVANQIEQEQRDSERQWQKQRETERQLGEELEP